MSQKPDGILRHIELVRDEVQDWQQYPFSIPAIAKMDRLEFHPEITFLVGENGAGKSTLIEAIALKAGFSGAGGSKNFGGQHRASESELQEKMRLARGSRREKTGFFLRAETMYNVSTEAESYGSYGWENLHEKSHGEAFLWVALNRFHSCGLYILDEPEAALSPQRQLSLLIRIRQLIAERSQFIISTHSPILMAYPGACIWQLSSAGIEEIAYTDTEHYNVTRVFLENPERMLNALWKQSKEDDA